MVIIYTSWDTLKYKVSWLPFLWPRVCCSKCFSSQRSDGFVTSLTTDRFGHADLLRCLPLHLLLCPPHRSSRRHGPGVCHICLTNVLFAMCLLALGSNYLPLPESGSQHPMSWLQKEDTESLATLQYTKTAVAKDTLLGFKVFWDLTFPHTATFIPLFPVTWFCRTHRTVPYLPKFSKVRNWPFMCRVVLALKIKFKSSAPSPPPQDCQSSLTKWRSVFQVTRYGSEGCHWKIHVFI